MNIKVGQAFALGATTDIELVIANVSPDYDVTAWVVVPAGNAGTIQFSVGEVVPNGQKAVAAGTNFPLTFRAGQRNIHVKGTNAADTLTIFV